MATRRTTKPADLPTKSVRAPDGTVVRLKVVKSDSETLGDDLLAAFRSNVRRVITERRKAVHASHSTEA